MPPLIRPIAILGAGETSFRNDEKTPGCALCGAEHVGITVPCYLGLRGHMAYIPQLERTVYVLDTRAQVEFVELPSGRKGLIVDLETRGTTAQVMHEDCADLAVRKLDALYDIDEEQAHESEEDDEFTDVDEHEEEEAPEGAQEE